jgi:hypothetical protein
MNKEKQIIILEDGSTAIKINLTQNKFAIIDENDFEKVNQFKWHFDGRYASRNVPKYENNKSKGMHRFILNPSKGMEVDHKNLNSLDNRRSNLRIATRSQNMMNRDATRVSKTGVKGVSWNKRDKRWVANLKLLSKTIYLGSFKDIESAKIAYNNGAKKYCGKFARLNKFI